MKAKNFAGAIVIAVLLTLTMAVPTIAHIDTWKIVVGLAGFALFVAAGLDTRPNT